MNARIVKVKNHLKENRVTYFVGAGCTVVGVAVGVIVFGNGVQIVDSLKLINWKSPHTSQTVLIRQGHPGYIVRCKETGALFPSQNAAAKAMGINQGSLSQHLAGKFPQAGGHTFECLGEVAAVA